MSILLAFFTSFFICYLFIPKLIVFAIKHRLFAPRTERAIHKGDIPSLGGIVICFSCIFSLILWSNIQEMKFILISLLIIFIIGILDDLLSLSPYKKVIGQIIAILIIIYLKDLRIESMHGTLGIYNLPHFVSTLFTVFVFIVITNGFNLIDGIDALAPSIGLISSIGFGLISFMMGFHAFSVISFILSGALIAFLKYNIHPAKIFMGDTGSLVVGMILSILAVQTISNGLIFRGTVFNDKGPLIAIALLSLPLFDSLRVFLNRIYYRRNPLFPAKDHIHHALLALGLSHNVTVFILCLISCISIVASLLLLKLNLNISIFILALINYSFMFIVFFMLKKKKIER